MLLLLACGSPEPVEAPPTTEPTEQTTSVTSATDLENRLAELEALVAAQQARIEELEEQEIPDGYTDEDAVAAVQNDDPWTEPDRANLQSLWSTTDYGYQWLDSSRWTMDNRADPAGGSPRHELVQMFHETPECTEHSTFADCNATGALKFYVNGPRITDNDWSEAGYAAAAVRRYHTHTSGIYLVSFGQYGTVTDYAYALIPPSGLHLEPHGAHQALRIDGTANSGENIRIDASAGSTGIAIYASADAGLYCDDLSLDCEDTYSLYLRGGRLHLEDLQIERSATDARDAGVSTLHDTSLGVEHFYSWHERDGGLPVHCTWNTTVTGDSLISVQPYSTSPDLTVAHSYAVIDVWGPGSAPTDCLDSQSIKTDAAGVYGYTFPASHTAEGGFSVVILGPEESAPLYPGDWQEGQRPAFLYEVIDAL